MLIHLNIAILAVYISIPNKSNKYLLQQQDISWFYIVPHALVNIAENVVTSLAAGHCFLDNAKFSRWSTVQEQD